MKRDFVIRRGMVEQKVALAVYQYNCISDTFRLGLAIRGKDSQRSSHCGASWINVKREPSLIRNDRIKQHHAIHQE